MKAYIITGPDSDDIQGVILSNSKAEAKKRMKKIFREEIVEFGSRLLDSLHIEETPILK